MATSGFPLLTNVYVHLSIPKYICQALSRVSKLSLILEDFLRFEELVEFAVEDFLNL